MCGKHGIIEMDLHGIDIGELWDSSWEDHKVELVFYRIIRGIFCGEGSGEMLVTWEPKRKWSTWDRFTVCLDWMFLTVAIRCLPTNKSEGEQPNMCEEWDYVHAF